MTRAARPVVAALCALMLTTACTRVVTDVRVVAAPDMGKAAATASDCTSVDAPMTTIPERTDEEPVMAIPQPDGWERVRLMDSDLIRFTMRNVSLARDGFAPTAVVTLESHRGAAEPREVFDAQQDALANAVGATNLSVTPTTLCELPAEMIDYTTPTLGILPPHPARVVTAVLNTDDTAFAMTITVQSADPDNPVYKRDAETILTGFQMLPPAGA
ncbi:MAG TPA: LpqN/LpqT family lipoprotein [Mycobacterium sp.]|nr:LpqN/LpqT family lipoprotein [Mycobacterium sp.]